VFDEAVSTVVVGMALTTTAIAGEEADGASVEEPP
jgi:hypothetical protein